MPLQIGIKGKGLTADDVATSDEKHLVAERRFARVRIIIIYMTDSRRRPACPTSLGIGQNGDVASIRMD
jgi:hypothetical protein